MVFKGDIPCKSFSISRDCDFYIVGKGGISARKLIDEQPVLIDSLQVEVYRDSINRVIQRAEFDRRYIVFSEDGRLKSRSEGVILIDFDKNQIKTKRIAHISLGSSQSDSFADKTGAAVAVCSPELKNGEKFH